MKCLLVALLVSLLLLTACGAPASVPPTATGDSAFQADSRITELEKELKAKEEAIAKLQQQMQEQQWRLDALTLPLPLPAPPAPARFVLSELTITPTAVKTGEVVTISIEVSNTGGIEGSYTVVFKVKGAIPFENVEVTLKAGQTKTVTFTTTKNESGTYTVDVNGKVGQFIVTAPTPAPPTPEELEAKLVIKDLAYIKILAGSYSDDADPDADGISLSIYYYDSKSKLITFQGIPVTVSIELYGYGNFKDWPDHEKMFLIWQKQDGLFVRNLRVTVTSSREGIRIPFENIVITRTIYQYGTMEVTVTTPKQGYFEAEWNLVRLYP